MLSIASNYDRLAYAAAEREARERVQLRSRRIEPSDSLPHPRRRSTD
jgi:hypothetical protein